MAAQLRQPTPPNGLHPHHVPPGAHSQINGHIPMHQPPRATPQHLSQLNEAVWISIGLFIYYRSLQFLELIVERKRHRTHRRSGWRDQRVRTGSAPQSIFRHRNESDLRHTPHKGKLSQGCGVPAGDTETRRKQR